VEGVAMSRARAAARGYVQAYRGLSRELWLLAFFLFVNRSGSMVLPFITLYLTQERGLGLALAGRVVALYGLGAAVGAYLGGWSSDRIGAIRTQKLSLWISGVGFLWLSTLRETAAIAVAVFLVSLISEAFRPAVMAALAERAPRELRARGVALLRLASNLGLAVAPAVGGLVAMYSYSWLFVGDALTCWLAAAWMSFSALRDDTSRPVSSSVEAGLSPWRDVPFLLLMVQACVVACVLFQAFSTMPIYLKDGYGLTEGAIGALMAWNAAIIVAVEMPLIHWIERFPRLPAIAVGVVLLGSGFALLPFGTHWGWAALAVTVWTAGEMLVLPLTGAIVADRSGNRRSGRYMGVYTFTFAVAFLFSPIVGTYVYAAYGATTLWLALGLVCWPVAWGTLWLRRALRRERNSPC
jgi:MFS family permease